MRWTRSAAAVFATLGLFAAGLAPWSVHVSSRVLLAAQRCPLDGEVRTAFPVGFGACPGVRPGAYFESPTTGCTFNFLFQGTDGHRYIGSAGHCLLDQEGTQTWSDGSGPVIKSDAGAAIGHGAYAILEGERDFSLIRLDPGVVASPQMCHFGGPTAIDEEKGSGPAVLEHYGNGLGISSLTPGRTAVALDTQGEDAVMALGVANLGDSGSGVTHDGRALGVLVALVVGTTTGNIQITRLAPQVAEAGQAIGTELALLTAPRL